MRAEGSKWEQDRRLEGRRAGLLRGACGGLPGARSLEGEGSSLSCCVIKRREVGIRGTEHSGGSMLNSLPRRVSAVHSTADPSWRSTDVSEWPTTTFPGRKPERPPLTANGAYVEDLFM